MNAPVATRRLGLFSATTLVVASMVGSGVFTTSGFLLADLQSPWLVLLAWLVGGGLAACGALCYGALARRLPESGGEYLFLSRTLHPAAGAMAGWISIVVGFAAPLAAAALAFGEYTRDWLPGSSPQWLGSGLLCGLALIHALRMEGGARLHNLTVALEMLLIGAFAVLALARLPAEVLTRSTPDSSSAAGFAVGLIWVSFSYYGWNAAVYVAGEVRDAERNLPRSLLIGTALVTGLYLALNAAFVFAAPWEALAGQAEIGRLAAYALGGALWADALTALIALVLAASVSAMTVAGSRVYARMAIDGELPRLFRAQAGVPRLAIAMQCTLALALMWSASFKSLLTYIGFTLNLCAAATVVGLIRIRLREGAQLRVVGWPLASAIFLLGVLWMALSAVVRQPVESLWGLATLAMAWLLWRLGRALRGEQSGH